MKKILTFSLLFLFVSAAASAQVGQGNRFRKHSIQRGFSNGQFTRPERFELRKDAFRYERLKHKSRRDGVVRPFERKRLRKAKFEGRRDRFRFRHNGRHRLI